MIAAESANALKLEGKSASEFVLQTQLGANSGAASLDSSGKLYSSQMPALAASDIPNLDAGKITTGTFVDTFLAELSIDKLINGSGKYFNYKPDGLACGDGKILKYDTSVNSSNGGWICGDDSTGGAETDPTVLAFAKVAQGVAGTGLSVNGSDQLIVSYGTTANTAAEGDDTRIVNAIQTTTTLGGDLSGNLPNPAVARIQGNAVSSAAPAAGQVYAWSTTNSQFEPIYFGVDDLKTQAGLSHFAVSCLASQTLTWSAVTDAFSCSNISIASSQVSGLAASATTDTTNASNIASGTVDSARLPAASSSADGIVNQIAQSFKGAKTFIDNVIIQGTLSITGALSGSSASFTGAVSADTLKVANSGATCNVGAEGSLKYNSTTKKMEYCNGSFWATAGDDPCLDSDVTPGTLCDGGTIFVGTLSPGATSGSGTDKYMTTPGNCADVPADGNRGGTSASNYYTTADFTPTCDGTTDTLIKYWNDGSLNLYDIPTITNYSTTLGIGNGAINTDANYGSANTSAIVAITATAEGGYHAAARYCDKLSYGGYTDWYLPNRYELNLFYTNKANIPGLDTAGNWYWSSSEYDSSDAWIQRLSDGGQDAGTNKNDDATRVRCVRKF